LKSALSRTAQGKEDDRRRDNREEGHSPRCPTCAVRNGRYGIHEQEKR
jgi:hypothetical protein